MSLTLPPSSSLNAALDAADPFTTARRYLAEFLAVVKQLRRLDRDIARTFANATFMAHAPRAKATAHFERFADLMMRSETTLPSSEQLRELHSVRRIP